MALNFTAATDRLMSLRKLPSAAFCLQAGACAIVAWSVWHGGLNQPPAHINIGSAPAAAATFAPSAAASTPTAAPAMELASATPLAGAQLALSTIDVVVRANDTLDGIFRRLKLSLADLASMRSLPGVRASLDSLRPG